MKRPLLLLLALPLCAFGAAKPADAQENFISNGSFDSRSGWSDDGTVSSDSDDKQNGFYVVRLGLKEKSFSTKIINTWFIRRIYYDIFPLFNHNPGLKSTCYFCI